MKRLMALVLIAATALAGCSTESAHDSSAQPAALASFTGEQLFAGIVFGYGPAAEAVPSTQHYVDHTIEITPTRQAAFDALIAEIRAGEPKFFIDFGRDVSSGDHVAIRAAIQRGATALRAAAERLQARKSNTASWSREPPLENMWIEVDIAVAVEIAIAAIAVLAVVFYKPEAPQSLMLDEVTDDLAALAAH